MMRYARIQIPMMLATLTMLFTGCSIITMEQVPSTDLIKKWMGSFLIEADQIKGVYRNLDIDSVVFTYRTGATTEQDFAESLVDNLADSKWQRQTEVTDFIEFRRVFAKGDTTAERPDMAIFTSLELVRLSFNPTNRTVTVAYVQADTSKNVSRFEETGEGKWAERTIWPKFDQLRKQ